VLPAEMFKNGISLSTLPLAKLRHNARAILKNYEMFIYGDIHYITNSFCKKCAKNSDTLA
jgi:hypothetical protein